MAGCRDEELAVRWVQYGVFSPIMRLHCAFDILKGKEPWNYSLVAEKAMADFMRLRHTMLPYLYTMNYKAAYEGEPLCQPLYYKNAYTDEAYNYKNEYYFGSELLVAPITQKADAVTNMGSVKAWLPEGEWFDIFTNAQYKGNRKYRLYRDISSIPVFAKAGAIIPTALNDGNDISNPKTLKAAVYPGESNSLDMYEDDGTKTENFAVTSFNWHWCESPSLEIQAPQDNSCIPKDREYIIEFKKLADSKASVTSNGKAVDFEKSYENDTLTLKIKAYPNIKIELESGEIIKNDYRKMLFDRLSKMHMENRDAFAIYKKAESCEDALELYQYVEMFDIDENAKNAIKEILAIV